MALDDLIKKAPKKPRPNKKKAAAGKGKGTPAKKGPGGVKAKVIGKARRGPRGGNASVAMAVDGAWAHDKFQGGRGRGPAVGGSAKLAISNLHFNVTNQDIKELFAQIGKVQKSGLNFDQNGRSKGTAEVVFANKRDAVQAIKTYNGVKLDGRPLQIELIGGAPGGMTLSSGVTITPAGGRRSVTFNGGGGGGRKVVAKVVARPGAKKGGAKAKAGGAKGAGAKGKPKPKPKPRAKKETPLTAEQLDAQMDAYKGAAAAADAAPADAPAAMEA